MYKKHQVQKLYVSLNLGSYLFSDPGNLEGKGEQLAAQFTFPKWVKVKGQRHATGDVPGL